MEKIKEIENHIYGSPQPHKSWRELLLLLIAGSALVIILVQMYKKLALPRVKRFISENRHGDSARTRSISEQVDKRQQNISKNVNKLEDNITLSDWNLKAQLDQMNSMMWAINESMSRIKDPFRAEQTVHS